MLSQLLELRDDLAAARGTIAVLRGEQGRLRVLMEQVCEALDHARYLVGADAMIDAARAAIARARQP